MQAGECQWQEHAAVGIIKAKNRTMASKNSKKNCLGVYQKDGKFKYDPPRCTQL